MADDRAEFQQRVEAAAAVLTEFNEKLAAATTYLIKTGMPVMTMLELLETHQARILATVEPRTARKLMREQLIAIGNARLAEAELQRGQSVEPEADVTAVTDDHGRTTIAPREADSDRPERFN